MKPMRVRKVAVAAAMVCALGLTARAGWTAPKCPLSYGTTNTDATKSHKLFLYFPTAPDSMFPNFDGTDAGPALPFDVADLDPAIGTTAALEDRIHDIVVDDYCEFNVQVLQTTINPTQVTPLPPNRRTIAVGSDHDGALFGGRWGQAPLIFDQLNDVDFARVWAGTYVNCEGGDGTVFNGCSMTGALTGTNSTLEHWAQAIGGTAAHEAGHTYGLAHTDDDPPNGNCKEFGPAPLAGEDGFKKHLMPNGCNLDGQDRTTFRRHFSDRTFGILAKNVGLAVQTMHNWDLVNPNAVAAHSLQMDFLSPKTKVNVDWTWTGPTSPWISPVVTSLPGQVQWQGKMFNQFRITWSKKNSAFPTPGVVPAGGQFHVGATFTGVDFNQPDPIVIQNIRLFDVNSKPLVLHPRLPMYDAGTVDSASGSFSMHFYPQLIDAKLSLQSAIVYQLPRVASIESMVGAGSPATFDGLPIVPWSAARCVPTADGTTVTCGLGNIADKPHVAVTRAVGDPGVIDCSKAAAKPAKDAPGDDIEGPVCAGTSRDPFPSTTVYVIATFVDPSAEHFDPRLGKTVVGPVT
ncbi:MAG TPA: hypothetical protein VGH73_01730, partial [Thermoanaerobaculia bacterium]